MCVFIDTDRARLQKKEGRIPNLQLPLNQQRPSPDDGTILVHDTDDKVLSILERLRHRLRAVDTLPIRIGRREGDVGIPAPEPVEPVDEVGLRDVADFGEDPEHVEEAGLVVGPSERPTRVPAREGGLDGLWDDRGREERHRCGDG